MFVCRILILTSDALVDITVGTGRTGVVEDHLPVNCQSVGLGAKVQRLLVKCTRLISCAFILVVNNGKLGPRGRSQAHLTAATRSYNNTG